MTAPETPTHSVDVLIVGCGPAGMLSALCLARRGVRSLVLERHAAVNEHPKAHELNTRSIEILHDLGITLDELATEASPKSDGSRILFCRTINEEFGRIDLEDKGGSAQKYREHFRSSRPYLNISQTELERILLRHLDAEPLIDLRWQHEWRALDQGSNGVTSRICDLKSDDEFFVESRYVLAADGAGSRVRKALGIEMLGPPVLQDFLNVYFEHNLREQVDTPAKLYWILHPAAPGAFIAHHLDKRWTYNMPLTSPWESRDDYPDEVLRERIHTALGFDAGVEIRSVSTWRMTVQIAERYREGRAFLVGDSGHRFPPTGGLGMNTGIADAHNLCWKLAAVLEGSAGDALLDSYDSERRPVAQRNAEESERNYHKVFEVFEAFGLRRDGLEIVAKVAHNPPVKWLPEPLRRCALGLLRWPAHRLLARFGRNNDLRRRVRSSIADQTAHFDRIGLDIGYVYREGALHPQDPGEHDYPTTEYQPSTEPGARLPHVSLDGLPDGASTHDLLAYDAFTLFIADASSGRAAAALVEELETRIEVVPLTTIRAPADGARAQFAALCALGDRGALLVRPDGHIAWRAQSLSTPGVDRALEEALRALALR